MGAVETFRSRLIAHEDEPLRILELGTLRWGAEPTHHKAWIPEGRWTLADISDGPDVDVVADAHALTDTFREAAFDVYIACSTYEHLERPWIAARSAYDVLTPGGIVYVDTHQTFPIHGYPDDFFRFSDRALALIFEDAGFITLEVGYTYPCTITPPAEVTVWNPAAPSWLNVNIAAQKPWK
jgi:SAM-dependent methyltransferase